MQHALVWHAVLLRVPVHPRDSPVAAAALLPPVRQQARQQLPPPAVVVLPVRRLAQGVVRLYVLQ